jgi:hypothetical protein
LSEIIRIAVVTFVKITKKDDFGIFIEWKFFGFFKSPVQNFIDHGMNKGFNVQNQILHPKQDEYFSFCCSTGFSKLLYPAKFIRVNYSCPNP